MARYKRIIIFLIILFSISGKVYSKNPPPGTGTSDVPANILIMLDNSGSMSSRLSGAVQIHYPVDVNVDNSGNIYVLEYWNNRIKKFDSSGNYITAFGGYGSNCNQWRNARQFDIKDNIIYISDTSNYRFVTLNLDGSCRTTRSVSHLRTSPIAMAVGGGWAWASGTDRIASHYTPSMYANPGRNVYSNEGGGSSFIWGMSWNNSGSRIAYANYSKNQVRIANRSGHQLVAQNSPYASDRVRNCNANRPTDTAWDSAGNVYYTSVSQHAVYKINPDTCSESKLVGSYSTSSGFRYPYGIEIDSSDNIFVTDYYNFTIRKYNTGGTETATIGGSNTRLEAAKKVIKKIVSNTDLTSGANFGLMEWGSTYSSRTRIRVKISDTGAQQIYSDVDNITASGGTNLNNALNRARDYFTSGQVANWNLSCSMNYLIVISDGYWSSHSSVLQIADILNNSNNIKTFAVGFALGGANNNYKTLAEKGGTTSPLYASNETELLAKLTDAIKQAISGRLTFTTPAVMSDVQKGDFVYQSTFEYEKNKQWKGSLKKYKLNSNGSFGAVQWDAADKLNSKSASSRKLWTAGISSTGTNNFTTSNRDELKPLIFPSQSPTDTQVDNLINFIRGTDTYDQDADNNKTESIHKLADIYHSNLIVVGPPEASTTSSNSLNFDKTDTAYRINNNYENFKNDNKNRTELIYAGANNGILHAFKTSDGEELWGFIPPVLHENFERIPSSKANATNPIYGVDGSPVVKDIYFDDTPNDSVNNPRWRTVLISGLGAGGNGIFALDVTDINNPKQLFAIKNDPTNKEVSHWGNSGAKNLYSYGVGSPPAEFDYAKLGESWSTPRIIRIKVGGVDKWVAVFGAGYNGTVNPDVGSAVFVMDLEDEGRLLKKIEIEDQANVMRNYVFGTVSNNTQTEFNLSNYGLQSYNTSCCKLRLSGHGDLGYRFTGDLNGDTMRNIKLTFDQAPPGRTNFTVSLVNKTDIVNSIPADISLVTADGTDKANYNGAIAYVADLEGKVTKINLTDKGTLYDKTTLFNAQSTSDNGRYIYTRPNITINNDNNLWLYFGTGNTQKLQEQSSNIQNRLYGIKDTNFPNFTSVSPGDISRCKTAPNCPGPSDLGWYVNLQNAQKLTAEPTVDKNRVYFPIYEPTRSTNACNTGKAILTGYDTKCGNSVLNVNMGTGVLSKVVVQGDNLYVGIAGEANKKIDGFTSSENLITGKSEAKGTGKVQIEAWREIF
jgi:type IV pilus assembly protein PilY1